MIKTFRAKSVQQALELVRRELGPDASVLHTRRLNNGLLGRLLRGSQIEVAATAGEPEPVGQAVSAPALPHAEATHAEATHAEATHAEAIEAEAPAAQPPAGVTFDYRERYRRQLLGSWEGEGPDGVGASGDGLPGVDLLNDEATARPPARDTAPASPGLIEPTGAPVPAAAPTALFDAFTLLLEADIDEPICRELLDEIRRAATPGELADPSVLRRGVRRAVEDQIKVAGPIEAAAGRGAGRGGPRVAALVGPTGVGKTTTLAKLAANFRLRQKLSVGLITVDTYRVAAVEQLQTYAEIIDLPMQVVATPREMRKAIAGFQDLDLVLLDTAGRSPRDEIKIQELKSILAEAKPDDVQLVLSATTSASSLVATAERFAAAGVTSLILTKLDEAATLGNAVKLATRSRLPFSYVTNGQNVPDDIAVADASAIATQILDGPGAGGQQ